LAFGGADDPLATQPVNFARADAPPMMLVQGEKDTLVRSRTTHALAKMVAEAGGRIETAMFAEMDHNAPILALASPWRRDRELIEAIKAFTAKTLRNRIVLTDAADATGASVPVQAEIR
jgi:acetyl esterase/lipase